MPQFTVTIERCVIDFCFTTVEAATAEDAQRLALEIPDEDLNWDVLRSDREAVEVVPELHWITVTP
jgi:hypothetical protein